MNNVAVEIQNMMYQCIVIKDDVINEKIKCNDVIDDKKYELVKKKKVQAWIEYFKFT